MPNLLSKLSNTLQSKPIEPREIFMTLPKKDEGYEYPRDVQSEVWAKWFKLRQQKNNIIKMNTGSGKTIVGLMILQSCLNENVGPAVYVVPDKYLAEQVCQEAKKLGINAVTDRDDYLYTENKAILVMPIHALVNGRSVFGMRSSNNYPIGSVLLDDVHACLETISSQFAIKIPDTHELYSKLINLFSASWRNYNSNSYINIVELQDPQKRELLPFWIWQEKQAEIYQLLSEYNNDAEINQCIYFNLPLLEDNLPLCNCIFTSKSIEITPVGISISKIKSFENAKRRIFMSATLADDSVFVSSIGLNEQDVTTVIAPNSANDIGDRLILFPKHLNSTLTDAQIRDKVFSLADKYNVVVIVPSKERAKFWNEDGRRTVTRENIAKAVSALKNKHVGLAVFVNRYDGIDLPNDACRILVIDGLPPLKNEYEKYVQSVNSANSALLREQIQRIEQGMGRGVRSNSDSCCVILMGDQLADVLLRNNGVSFFSQATAAQYSLSKELWDLLKQEEDKPSIDSIFELAEYSLGREIDWIRMSKERLSSVTYTDCPKYDQVALYLRRAYEFALSGLFQKATDEIDKAMREESESSSQGYLLQIKALYCNPIDKTKAQEILLAAHVKNHSLLLPIVGIQYSKAINNKAQAVSIVEFNRRNFENQNTYIIHIDATAAKLSFSPDADGFEGAIKDVGEVLGFISTRPDKETSGQGPDNLWAIGNNKYFIIECKSGAVSDTISKEYCNQLGGSIRWFNQEYGAGYEPTPVMVHPSKQIDNLATPVPGMRIITSEEIELIKKQLKSFAVAVSQAENWNNESKIQVLLQEYHLRGQDFVQQYTVPFID